jgi:hypothetical protein
VSPLIFEMRFSIYLGMSIKLQVAGACKDEQEVRDHEEDKGASQEPRYIRLSKPSYFPVSILQLSRLQLSPHVSFTTFSFVTARLVANSLAAISVANHGYKQCNFTLLASRCSYDFTH